MGYIYVNMSKDLSFEIVVVGGGIAGLAAAKQLVGMGISVAVVEQNTYPFHRVCGEYVSNETVPFLERIGLFPGQIKIANINKFLLSDVRGRQFKTHLPLGGFGVSRYKWDHWAMKKVRHAGGKIIENIRITSLKKELNQWVCKLSNGENLKAKFVIGAFGKRSVLDRKLDRGFMARSSPYVGIKYHVATDFDENTVALHNFPGGYCGFNKIEEGRYNLCYLTLRRNIKKAGNINKLEKVFLGRNPLLKEIIGVSRRLVDKPSIINNIYFGPKETGISEIPMIGDSAGLITPLCGNGMAIAIHSSKILVEAIGKYWKGGCPDHYNILKTYTAQWNKRFFKRLKTGRVLQNFFGSGSGSLFAISAGRLSPASLKFLIKQTHGKPF